MARDEKEKQKERDEGKRKERERKKEEREALRKKNAAPYPVQHHKRPIASSPGNALANNGFAKQDDPSQNYRGASSPVKAFSGAPPRQLDDAQRYITAVEAKKRYNVTRVDLKGVHFNNDARWSDGVSVRFYKEEDVKKRALEIAEKKRELELADKARRQ
ncbi:hypothetical protein BCR35DRAFT_301310 [Leucosporidium creatinivorum]|uniref:Uncharacterized protein n=1 Tax=Leucosporidium creatinivorum TaxID=106004 RepID=A0A1Y2FWZ2_9BASI|nr:hypothetical protein BCR35DRAFT_301310 [Leucosporidium creatinivorum]